MVTGHIWILPSDPVVHVGTGGQLNLDCVVDTGPVQPQFILWYRDDRIVAYDDNIDAEVIFFVFKGFLVKGLKDKFLI